MVVCQKRVGNSSNILKFSGSPFATKVVQIPPTFGSGVLALIWYRPEAISFIRANLTVAKKLSICKCETFLPFDMRDFLAFGLPPVVFSYFAILI